MTQPAPDTTPPAPAPLIFCSEAECKEPALFSYVWPWGEPGACCSLHRIHVAQRSENLGRGQVNFTTIDPGRPVAITRDERTQLRAGLMTAEEDLRAAQARAATLYGENTALREQLRQLKARDLESGKQLGERKADIERLISERDAARADAGEAQAEVADLRAMLPRSERETETGRRVLAPPFPNL